MNVCSLCLTVANRAADSDLTVMISNSELHFIYIRGDTVHRSHGSVRTSVHAPNRDVRSVMVR